MSLDKLFSYNKRYISDRLDSQVLALFYEKFHKFINKNVIGSVSVNLSQQVSLPDFALTEEKSEFYISPLNELQIFFNDKSFEEIVEEWNSDEENKIQIEYTEFRDNNLYFKLYILE